MKNPSNAHHRRSIRLKGFDYRQGGAYFVTLVVAGRENLFGKIDGSEMVLNETGKLVAALWQALPFHFPISLGNWVVMPNHHHGIIVLRPDELGLNDIDHPEIIVGGRGEAVGRVISGAQIFSNPTASPLRAPHGTAPGSLAAIVQSFKSLSTRRVNALRNTTGAPLWQRNYYEHIIRNDEEWDLIARYISSNPLRWAEDEENPFANVGRGGS